MIDMALLPPMNNRQKYDQAFQTAFENDQLESTAFLMSLEYQSIEEWDSVGHMNLMSILEEIFDITLEMDDIIDFASYAKGIETLQKYGIDIS